MKISSWHGKPKAFRTSDGKADSLVSTYRSAMPGEQAAYESKREPQA